MTAWLRHAFNISVALIALAAEPHARAQTPEGPPLPVSGVARYEIHSRARIGYFVTNSIYRYHGDYRVDGNFSTVRANAIYGMADVDVDAFLRASAFQPDRLIGTFEVGDRNTVGRKGDNISLFLRHQSAHGVDRSDQHSQSWESVGVRYVANGPRYQVATSVGYYVHPVNLFYHDDLDVQGTYRIGMISHKILDVRADLHYLGENGGNRSGFVDYWIEPTIWYTSSFGIYAGYGTVHDIDRGDGRTASPLIVGAKLSL